MRIGAQVCAHPLEAEEDEEFHRSPVGAAQPVRYRRVELGRLARRQRQVAFAGHQPQAAAEHVQPFEAFVGLRGRFERFGPGRAGPG